MKTILIKIFLLTSVTLFFQLNLYSQIDCPPDDPNCTPWTTVSTYFVETVYYQFDMQIDIQTRNCGGNVEVRPVWNSAIPLRYVGMSMEGMWELFMYDYIRKTGLATAPDCGIGTSKISFYFTSECKSQTKCTYKIIPAEENCDDCFPGTPPYYEKNGEYFIDYYRSINCGEKCCKHEFEICKDYDELYNRWEVIIVSRNKIEVTSCPPSGCTDWDSGQPIPCTSNCNH